jgi:hypothetical protein
VTPPEALRRLVALHESWVIVADTDAGLEAVTLRQCAEDLAPLIVALTGATGPLGAPAGVPTAYATGLLACTTLAELQAHVRGYAELAQDAGAIVGRMTAEDWTTFAAGLPAVRAGGVVTEDWLKAFGAVLVPEPMLSVATLADVFEVPFSVALARVQAGLLPIGGGRRDVH